MSSTSRSLTAARRQPAARLRPLLAAMLMAGAIGPLGAATTTTTADTTLPTGMTLRKGVATVSVDEASNVMTATQTSSRAVWEASDFSVGAKAAFVNNATLGANTDTLIRVVGFNPSVILGPVTANNRLWLVNSNGLYVGATGSISAASVMMSARDVSGAEVESGYATFMNPDQKAALLMDASSNDFSGGYVEIDARTDGQPAILATGADGTAGGVVLMGSTYVYNKGVVQANGGGAIGMVSANEATVQVGDSGFIELAPLSATATRNNTGGGRAVVNEGTIQADDGSVELIVAGAGNDSLGTVSEVRGLNATGLAVNGVANVGTIVAHITRAGGSSSVLMESVGGTGTSVVANVGTVDVSALDGVAAKGGSIDLIAPNVGNGAVTGQARLLADGDQGGGDINLIIEGANGDTNLSGRLVTTDLSLISADARVNGQGGTVRLLGASNVASFTDTQTTTSTFTGGVATRVTLQGTLQARGGTASGDGGRIVASGSTVSLRATGSETTASVKPTLDVRARSSTGKAGWLKFYAPDILIGTEDILSRGVSSTTLADTDLSAYLSDGANIEIGAYRPGIFGGAYLYVEPGTQLISTSGSEQTLRLLSDGDASLGNGYSSDGINIESSEAPLNVAVTADLDGDGDGRLDIQGLDPDVQLASVPGQATAQGVQSQVPVTMRTRGGAITLTGRTRATTDNSYGDAIYIRNALFDTQGGRLTIKGVGGVYEGEGQAYNNGITIQDASFTAGDIDILGGSLAATGVNLDGVSLATSTNGQITIHGHAQGGAAANQPIGVDIAGVDISLGASGQLKLTGLAQGGGGNDAIDAIGVRVDTMTVYTTGDTTSAAVPRITIVGESAESVNPGLQVNRYINVFDTREVPVKVDMVLGAKADAQAVTAMTLGSSYFNIAGRLNLRPMQVDTEGVISPDHATAIYVGPTSGGADAGTNFVVDPNLFSGQMGSGMTVVVGSSRHTGHITVADDVFNGSVVTTLQNQGEGASGITLGKQTGQSAYMTPSASVRAQAAADGASAGVLNLLSAGDINQTGPLSAQSLFVVAGAGAAVNLTDPGNVVGTVLISGGSEVSVAAGAGATPASTATATGYDAGAQQFDTVTVSANTPDTREPSGPIGPTEAEIAATPSRNLVESSEALSELRTDVYVRGQFTRPQVCTPANTGGGTPIDVDADPLAQQWLQVRRSAQLSSCSGVRNDSNCSAF